MKSLVVACFICISINAFPNSDKPVYSIQVSPPDTTVLPQILNLPISNYIGKPVDSLFAVLPPGYTGRGFIPTRVGYSSGVY
jgi:hypothetical protein